jgi:TPR repeat protein
MLRLSLISALPTVKKDPVEAVMWLRKAAEQGNAQAQFNLGCAYYFGSGVAKDHVEKAKWFRKAAQQGIAEAQWLLGESYYYGNGVAKDQVEGYAWVNLGAMTDEFAKKTRAVLEKRLTAQQIADGQRRSAELSALIEANKASL